MLVTRWTDGNGNKNITIYYAGKSRTFTNECDANAYRLKLEREILQIEDFQKGEYNYGKLAERNNGIGK